MTDFSEKIACGEALDTTEVSSYVADDYPTVKELLENRHWILVRHEPQEGITKDGRRVTLKTSTSMTVQSAIDYTRWIHKNIEERRGEKYKSEIDESLLWDYIVVNWIDTADDVIKTQLTEKDKFDWKNVSDPVADVYNNKLEYWKVDFENKI